MSKIGPASQTSQQKLREVDAVVVIKPKKGGDKEMKEGHRMKEKSLISKGPSILQDNKYVYLRYPRH